MTRRWSAMDAVVLRANMGEPPLNLTYDIWRLYNIRISQEGWHHLSFHCAKPMGRFFLGSEGVISWRMASNIALNLMS
jgi:hypothetical protein